MKKHFLHLIIILLFIAMLAGCAGKSAYEIAVENGFIGSESEWLDSLRGETGAAGEQGEQGDKGLSAYEVAVANGFSGSYTDWILSLRGDAGKDGENGEPAPSIVKSYIDEKYHLIIEMSDGTVFDAGFVGQDMSEGRGQPLLSDSETCVVPGVPYIIGCNLSGIHWKSSDSNIVRVAEGGLVLGVAEGKATITATSHTGETATCIIEVASYTYTLKSDGKVRIDGYSGFNEKPTIPASINGKSVDEIGEWAFFGNTVVKEVVLGDGITKLGDGAFNCCEVLEKITFPDTLTHIGDTAFSGCEKLLAIELPESLTYLGETAFNMCTSLTSVKIPSKIKRIENSTFNYCSSLASVELGQIESIGEWAFHDCDALKSVEIPASVTAIEHGAFARCGELETVVLKNPDTLIGQDAFLETKYQPANGLEFTDVQKVMYVFGEYGANVRSSPDTSGTTNIVVNLPYGEAVNVTGVYYEDEAGTLGWARVVINDFVGYVRLSVIQDTDPNVTETPTPPAE